MIFMNRLEKICKTLRWVGGLLSNDNSCNDTSPTSFFVLFFCQTTFKDFNFKEMSKKRSFVKGILTLSPNPNPKPYWTIKRGRNVVGRIVVPRKVGTRNFASS